MSNILKDKVALEILEVNKEISNLYFSSTGQYNKDKKIFEGLYSALNKLQMELLEILGVDKRRQLENNGEIIKTLNNVVSEEKTPLAALTKIKSEINNMITQ